jgi:hypothetical protein
MHIHIIRRFFIINMDTIQEIVNKYYQAEVGEGDNKTQYNNNNGGNSSNSDNIHHHHHHYSSGFSTPWVCPASSSQTTIINNNNAPEKQSQGSKPPTDAKEEKKKEEEENKSDPLVGLALTVGTAVVAYGFGRNLNKVFEISHDQRQVQLTGQMQGDNVRSVLICRDVENLLATYKSNQVWSLANTLGIAGAFGIGLIQWLVNTNQSSNSTIPWCLFAGAIVSGGLRCGMWYSSSRTRVQKLKQLGQKIDTVLNTPPAYNPQS